MNGEELNVMEVLGGRRVAVERLLSSEGWKLFDAAMKDALRIAKKQMIETSVSHDAAKFMGAVHTLENVVSWGDRELHSINMQVLTIEESSKYNKKER